MAYEIPGFSFSLVAGQDFSAKSAETQKYTLGQYRPVSIGEDGKAYTANHASAKAIVGVRQNNPRLGGAVTVVQSGISHVEAGGVIAAGDSLSVDATSGLVVSGGAGTKFGIALEPAPAAGVYIAVLLSIDAA